MLIARHLSAFALTVLAAFSGLTLGFSPAAPSRRVSCLEAAANANSDDNCIMGGSEPLQGRRAFISTLGLSMIVGGASVMFSSTASAAEASQKVVVLGGTGFVGSRVVQRLKSLGVDVIATSRDGRDGTVAFDVTSLSPSQITSRVEDLARGSSAVISCIGAIGTSADEAVNAASASAALGAKSAGAKKFVYIAVAPEVAEFAKDIDFLQPYLNGKTFSIQTIRNSFASGATIISPTFIQGGDKFSVNPPRVAGFYGNFIEGFLSSAPLRAITNAAPKGIVKIALEPPVSVDAVAGAAVASALGLSISNDLDTYDAIKGAASML